MTKRLVIALATIFALVAIVLLFSPWLGTDTHKFQFGDLQEAKTRDPATIGWFPSNFPKSAKNIRGQAHIDSNSIAIEFSSDAGDLIEFLKGSQQLDKSKMDQAASEAAKLSSGFRDRNQLQFFGVQFKRANSDASVTARIAVNQEKTHALLWYSLPAQY